METELITLTGVVEDITFQNDTNGFTVLDFSTDDELFTASLTYFKESGFIGRKSQNYRCYR